jgi:hypothetical protein
VALAGGPIIAENLVLEQHPQHYQNDAKNISLCPDDVAERLMTIIYVQNSDMNRFGIFVEVFSKIKNHSRMTKTYPQTPTRTNLAAPRSPGRAQMG